MLKIYQCKEELRLQGYDRQGEPVEGKKITVPVGMAFTATDDQEDTVRLEGVTGLRLSVSQQTLEKHFEELA